MNPTGKDLLQRKIEFRNLVILGLMLAASLLVMPWRFTLGILLGGIISIVNLYWLGRDLRVIFSNLSGKAKSAMMIRYYIRMAVTAVVLFFIITELPVDIVGLLLGLSLVVINIVVTAILEFQKKILPEEAS
ncbi:MAG TPA: ATP synthase subunit I [Syntrophales bacterium]|nr:ATP synthase subunit I [Syntrophales bacterium]HQL90526.1 ATP synthase subunit I [Syntrophales bacterium]